MKLQDGRDRIYCKHRMRRSAKIAIIGNITEDISSSYGANPKPTFLSDVSNIRIRSISENSNTKI